jgi:uncharacterized protein
MYRTIENQLIKWKNDTDRKPLIIRGARQIGKSWIIEHFGKENYSGKTHVINFEKRPELHAIFNYNFDISRIILELEIQLNIAIDPKKDLIFFDEIQACPKALMSLRYFYEEFPTLNIISAGSLMDFVLKEIPYPVGRVEHLDMHPMSFSEFLIAVGNKKLSDLISNKPTQFPENIDLTIKHWLSRYFAIGGMPKCVKTFIETNSLLAVNKVQDDLNLSILQDFKKYSPSVNSDCLNDILTSVLSNIGGQIKYTSLSDRFTGPTIKKGFELLKTARILHQVQNVSLAGLPLTPSGIQFKAIFLDIGLLIRMVELPIADDFIQGTLIASFKGALAEQFVGQEIKSQTPNLKYWMNLDKGTISEIDYVIEKKGEIIPIEVKSGASGTLKSLHIVLKKYATIKNAIVFSNSRFGAENRIQFLPIYWAGNILKN